MLTKSTCIYAAICLKTGKRYIGSSLNGIQRSKEHIGSLNRGRHHNRHFQNSWNKHGADQFVWELIEECAEEDLLVREQFWVNHYRSAEPEFGFNIAYPYRQPIPSARMSESHKAYWGSLTDGEKAERVRYLGTEELQALASAGKREETARKRASDQMKVQWQDPEFYELIVTQLRARLDAQWQNPEKRAEIGGKISRKAKARWTEPEYRERGLKQINEASQKARELLDDPVKMQERLDLLDSVRDKAAVAVSKKWEDPEFRAKRIAQMKKPRPATSEAGLKSWADPEIRAKRLAGQAAARAKRKAEKSKH